MIIVIINTIMIINIVLEPKAGNKISVLSQKVRRTWYCMNEMNLVCR